MLGIKQTILLKLIKPYFPEKQEDHVNDIMLLQNGVAVLYMASSAPFFIRF